MTAIQNKLTAAWARERRFFHLRGLARLTPWFVGLFLFDLLLDWGLDLSASARVVLLLANLGLLGWLLYRHWLSYLKRFDETRVSLQVEKLHPGLHNLLVSYVQLSPESDPALGSKQMIRVMRSQAEKEVSPLDFRGIVNFRSLQKLLIASAVVLVLFLAGGAMAGEYYVIFMGRMLNPFGSLEYPTRTRITEVLGPTAVRQGDPAELTAKAAGEVPDKGRVLVKVENASWEEFPLDKDDKLAFTHKIPRAGQDFSYQFRIGDARSKIGQVKVVPPPRLVETLMTLRFPPYTGMATKVQKGLQLEAPLPAGTTIEWELRCDRPLKFAVMHLAGDAPQSFELTPDAKDAHVIHHNLADVATLIPSKDRPYAATAYYQFDWTEKEHGFTFADATRYAVEVIPDKPPTIILLRPRPTTGEENKILATTRLEQSIMFDASDDYGLDRAWLIYRVNGEKQPRAPVDLGSFLETDKDGNKFQPRESLIRHKWRIEGSLPGVKEGDMLTCMIEVSDNKTGDANRSRSPAFKIHVVSVREYQAGVTSHFKAGLGVTAVAAQEELNSSKKVKSLIPNK